MKRLCCIIPLVLSLAGCLSPTYTTPAPSDTIPHAYKEEDGGRAARPADDAPKGDWWLTFNDPTLNGLIAEADAANQNIASSAANLRRARAQAATARAAFFPTLGATGSALRTGNSDGPTKATYSGGMSAQWEVGFWNAIPAYESAKAGLQATAADYASMRLLIRAEVAQNYFQLRTLDMQHDLYESTIAAYAKAVQLTRSQFREGMVTAADVAQAEAQLASAEAQLAALDGQRATLEHSLAVLVGKLPSNFTLERGELIATLPNTCRFASAVALARQGKETICVLGTVEGILLNEARGSNGFGYDPYFYYPPIERSFAELSAEQKNSVSHRKRALEALQAILQEELE